MTELEKAARMALEFCEFCWRDVSMNDYALEKLEQTTVTLTQALATTERKGEPVAWLRQEQNLPGMWTFDPPVIFGKTKPTDREAEYRPVAYCDTSPQVPEGVQMDAERYRKIRQGSAWPCAFASHDAPEPLTGDDLDAAIDAARKGE